jgi:integrase
MSEISAKDIIQWQNEMMRLRGKDGKPFSATYLKTMHNQVSAIFNHAVKFYDLKNNPATKAGSIGKKEAKEMLFWTKDEYLKFSDAMMDKPISFYAFEMLYWCGIRIGELFALTPADFDFNKNTVIISKSYQRINKEDIITEPKTPKSNRTIKMPDFLCQEIQEYIKSLYSCEPSDRLFPISKSYLHHEMARGSKATGVKRIKVHSLRHSHVSHLIDLGFSAVAIADRVGHESIDITFRYAHMFPSKQDEMADKLDLEHGGDYKCH